MGDKIETLEELSFKVNTRVKTSRPFFSKITKYIATSVAATTLSFMGCDYNLFPTTNNVTNNYFNFPGGSCTDIDIPYECEFP